MEAFLKEGGGGDHLTVRVKLPSGSTRTPLMKNLYTRPPVGKLALKINRNFCKTITVPTYLLIVANLFLHSPLTWFYFRSCKTWPSIPIMA